MAIQSAGIRIMPLRSGRQIQPGLRRLKKRSHSAIHLSFVYTVARKLKLFTLSALAAAVCHASSSTAPLRQALYFLRADPAGGSVVAIGAGADGLLVGNSIKTISTAGKGLQAVNSSSPNMAPVGFAPLLSQGALVVGDNYTFTVNSGSHTVVMYKINPLNPIELTMVGKPVSSLGQFPNSVAYSAMYKKLCVLNGGAMNGVACYNVDSTKGLIPDDVGLREFGFAAKTPPQLGGADGSGSNIMFSPESMVLLATFKGTSTGVGHIVGFTIDSAGNVAKKFADTQLPQVVVPFGMAPSDVSFDEFFVADPAVGGGHVLIFDYKNASVELLSTTNNTASKFSCWALLSNGAWYNLNAGSPTIGQTTTYIPESGPNGELYYTSALQGGFDGIATTFGDLIYFLNHVNDVAVFNTTSSKLVQRFRYGTLQNRNFWTGLTIWPAGSLNQGEG